MATSSIYLYTILSKLISTIVVATFMSLMKTFLSMLREANSLLYNESAYICIVSADGI